MGSIRKGEIRKSERFNFACTPEMVGVIHTVAELENLSPSEMIRKLIQKEYDGIIRNKYLNLDLKVVEEAQNV
jgi:ATP-dependent protease Clp ATPase subunit